MFRAIACDKFAPFGSLLMRFPAVENKAADLAEVHLLTGVNGTGKSRILAILAAALGQVEPLKRRAKDIDAETVFHLTDDPNSAQVNPNGWVGGGVQGSQFQYIRGGPIVQWTQGVPAFAYSGMAYVTDAPITVMADVPKPDRMACLLFNRPETQSTQLLQAIANLKVQAAMDMMDEADAIKGSSHATRLVRVLETVISQVTGQRFAFQVSSYPKAVLKATWGNIPLPFDGLPDGLKSIIGWLVHAVVMMDALLQGKSSPLNTEAVFLLDEIEGFLHPAWQRKILPAFQALFPKAQIFVATHSPFLIASLHHGWIHQFTQEEVGKVKIEKPIPASKGDSYVTVLEDIMGVKEWYDPETEALLSEFRSKREAAYTGDVQALDQARALAVKIGDRSMELGYMMGKELKQMDRQLAGTPVPQ